jgi:16S rRNA (cytidine1402-2'-O)-methyltransferase
MSGVFYIIATPIGHLDDISYRAIELLSSVDLIAAEDTRVTQRLLKHYEISTPMISMHEHNEIKQTQVILSSLKEGNSIALVSDAGTPLLSDPGEHCVAYIKRAGVQVVPVPGANALIATLSASGLSCREFCFQGFLPPKAGDRLRALEALKDESRLMAFYEAPHRIVKSIESCIEVFGETRMACLGKEITKTYETILTKPLSDILQWLTKDPLRQKGEFVLLVSGEAHSRSASKVEQDRVLQILLEKLSVKEVASLAAKILGESKNTLYQRALGLKVPGGKIKKM